MTTVLERGGTYLVTEDGKTGVIVDRGKVSPVKVQAALALGFWRPFAGDPRDVLATVFRHP